MEFGSNTTEKRENSRGKAAKFQIISWCLKFDIFHLRSQIGGQGPYFENCLCGSIVYILYQNVEIFIFTKMFQNLGILKYIETNVKIVHIFKMHETLYIYLSQQAGNYGTGRGILKKVSGFGLLLPMPRNNKQINSCRCRAGGQKYLQAGDCPR